MTDGSDPSDPRVRSLLLINGVSRIAGAVVLFILFYPLFTIIGLSMAAIPFLLVGGAAGLGVALLGQSLSPRLPGVFGGAPPMSGSVASYRADAIRRLRQPWLMVLATVPFFVTMAYVVVMGSAPAAAEIPEILIALGWGFVHTYNAASGVESLQVARALRREASA